MSLFQLTQKFESVCINDYTFICQPYFVVVAHNLRHISKQSEIFIKISCTQCLSQIYSVSKPFTLFCFVRQVPVFYI